MTNPNQPVAIEITVSKDSFSVFLEDGRNLRVPFEWFPTLNAATPDQRRDVAIFASGNRLHWHQLDEDISVGGLLRDAEHFQIDENSTSRVPDDFPWDIAPGSLAGAQPKLAGRKIGGRVVVGLTAAERFHRWDLCEDLAQQLVPKTLNDAAKYPENSRDTTLQRMRRAIEKKQWTERLETDWLMARLCVLLGW